jgi:hypothetical protein
VKVSSLSLVDLSVAILPAHTEAILGGEAVECVQGDVQAERFEEKSVRYYWAWPSQS